MKTSSKTVWSDQLVLLSEHLQQAERYMEGRMECFQGLTGPYPWGFDALEINTEPLKTGKLGLATCSGIFPDGTPFSIARPQEIEPLSLSSVQPGFVHLALPSHLRENLPEIGPSDRGLRYVVQFAPVVNTVAGSARTSPIELELAVPNMRLIHENEMDARQFTSLPVAKLLSDEDSVKIDDAYWPPILNIMAKNTNAGRELLEWITRWKELLGEYSKNVSRRVSIQPSTGTAIVSSIVNRYALRLEFSENLPLLPPHALFLMMLEFVGEMSAFSTGTEMPDASYSLTDLRSCFDPLIRQIEKIIEKWLNPVTKLEMRQSETQSPPWERWSTTDSVDVDEKARFFVKINHSVDNAVVGPDSLIDQWMEKNMVRTRLKPVELVDLPQQLAAEGFHSEGFHYYEMQLGRIQESLGLDRMTLLTSPASGTERTKVTLWRVRE